MYRLTATLANGGTLHSKEWPIEPLGWEGLAGTEIAGSTVTKIALYTSIDAPVHAGINWSFVAEVEA